MPIINGLSQEHHPVQILADYLTMVECKKSMEDMKNLKVAYVGDGNNIANSWIILASKMGFHLAIASPLGYQPDSLMVESVKSFANESGAKIEVMVDPKEAVKDADVVTTDTWASMGQEDEKSLRAEAFRGYCVDMELFSLSKKDSIFLHCLPAYRGQEVSEEVIESQRSKVFLEAENRLHIQKGIMVYLHEKNKK